LKTSPEETELKLYLLLFLAPDWSNNRHRRLFVQSAFNHFESDVEENLKLAKTRLKKRTSLFKMILSQLKEEQTARGIVTFTLAVRINTASNLFEHACMILRRLCKSCFYV